MGAPVLIGAGIGAVSSLAMGRNPLQGAILGGVTGGAFGGSTGFGSGFTEGGLFNLGSAVTPSAAIEPSIWLTWFHGSVDKKLTIACISFWLISYFCMFLFLLI